MAKYPSVPGDLNWHISRTCDGGACIRVARHGESVLIGNTTDPEGPVIPDQHDDVRARGQAAEGDVDRAGFLQE